MSKQLREAVKKELTKRARKAGRQRWVGLSPEERSEVAREAALSMHRKLGHKMTSDAVVPDGEEKRSKDTAA